LPSAQSLILRLQFSILRQQRFDWSSACVMKLAARRFFCSP